MAWMIFTDLDGSLLDHGDYSFSSAKPSLETIKAKGIPLIFTTSKTLSETEQLQTEMGIREPCIVEEGGGIFFPCGYRDFVIGSGEGQEDHVLLRLGAPYSLARNFLKKVGERFDILGFGDLSAEDLSHLTGLPPAQAEMAKDRQFTEPFMIKRRESLACLCALAAEKELKVTRGGRFYHLTGIAQDKGAAVRIVRDIFTIHTPEGLTTIGIGDSENDLPMLEQVDIPVLIPGPDVCPPFHLPGLIRARYEGARGWNDAVLRILEGGEGPASSAS